MSTSIGSLAGNKMEQTYHHKAVPDKGMTLIEILVAIAIIGILAAIFMPMFASAYMNIIRAGNKSDIIYNNQNTAEDKAMDGAANGSSELTVVFPGITFPKATGEKVTNGNIQMFIPK